MEVTKACPWTKRLTQEYKDWTIDGGLLTAGRNVTPTLKYLHHPLDKILEGIPAESSLPAVGRGFQPYFSETLPREGITMRCHYCEWRCELGQEKLGICRMYVEQEGVIKERFPNRWCSYGVSRIESIPFYHAYPGSRSMIIGTSSCNLSCRYCSNAYIAKEDPEKMQDRMYDLSPKELIQMARKLGCHNIVFSINEPTVSLPTLLKVAEEAKKAGIPLGCLTNAYTTEESTELLSSIFSFFNIGLKGLSMEFNRDYIGIPTSEPILRNIRRLARISHVEVTTPIIQSVNDGEFDEIVRFLVSVDRKIPWHVFRLLPEHQMKDAQYPNIEAIHQALNSVRKQVPYIYFHNFVGSDWVNTLCPNCGSDVIERFSLGCGGDRLNRYLCEDNHCPNCHQEIKLLGGKVDWNSKEVLA